MGYHRIPGFCGEPQSAAWCSPIIVVDHPTDLQKWEVLHRDAKFHEKHFAKLDAEPDPSESGLKLHKSYCNGLFV